MVSEVKIKSKESPDSKSLSVDHEPDMNCKTHKTLVVYVVANRNNPHFKKCRRTLIEVDFLLTTFYATQKRQFVLSIAIT